MDRFSITAINTVVAITAIGALVLAMGTAASAQLVNGSFELPASSGLNQIISGGDSTSITGWTTTRSGVERFDPSIYDVGPAPSGSIVIDICPNTFTGGGIQQTFSTTAGQTYMLSFFAATSNAFGRTGDAVINVSVGNASQSISLVNRQNLAVWNTYNMGFTATAASTTLLFDNLQDANTHFAFIDGVDVSTAAASTAPEPGSLALLAVPLLGLVTARRRREETKRGNKTMKTWLLTFALIAVCAPASQAQFLSDPAPVRVDTGSQITFTKELSAYPNYGTDGGADILYTGNTGAWTFTLSQSDLNRLSGNAIFQTVMTLDDHYSVPVGNYSFAAQVNGVVVTPGAAILAHGAPFDSIFNNWSQVTISSPSLVAGVNTLRLINTGTAGTNDWIAVDRIGLIVPTASAVAPEPSTLALLALPLVGAIAARRRKNH